MNKVFYLLIILFSFQPGFAQNELTVMTFNIRYNNPSDSLNAWPYRKDKVSSQVLFYKADILAVQEALDDQIKDIQTSLIDYSYAGVGRDDGKTAGEYSAIFYNNKRLELLKTATCWLSETPSVPGRKGWDAVCARIITWVELKDKNNGKTFFVFNTHFDHIGKIARRQSSFMLLHAVDSIAGSQKAIITGDFNAHPDDEPIQLITNPNDKLHLTETKSISQKPHYGPTGTFNAFGPKEVSDQPIDYIFFNHGVEVSEHATISESWGGRFASDHFAVMAIVRLLP